ncbi:MAG: hypothetical protein ACJ8FY_25820 [Gemmataceae bacterium]
MNRAFLSSTLVLTFFAGLAIGQESYPACESVVTQSRPGRCPSVAPYARPSDTGRYCGYYVGGGSAWRGEPRYPSEGTWGWDYCGFGILPKRIALQWSHGRRYQGGTGAYKTDGPPVPNILALPPPAGK